MKQKLITIFVAIATFFVGIIGTLLVFHYVPFKKEIINTTETKECFEFKETNSLKESIQKVYDAVVYVISYRNGRFIVVVVVLSIKRTKNMDILLLIIM